MVAHADPGRLALIALGEQAPEDAGHVRGCPRCQAELGQFSRVVAVAREAGEPGRLETPPPGLWGRIAAATIIADRENDAPVTAPQPARSAFVPVPPWWRRPALAAAGLVVLLAIAAGAWAGARELARSPGSPAPQATVVARIALRPLPEFPQWHAAKGTAVMAAGQAGQQLTVTLHAPDRAGFYEVWLLARDGRSMISLGDLGPGHQGTFTMPPGVDLANYSRVDVSLQAFNGSTVHSPTSVVRGSLPPA